MLDDAARASLPKLSGDKQERLSCMAAVPAQENYVNIIADREWRSGLLNVGEVM